MLMCLVWSSYGQIITDDFDDNSLDITKWTVELPEAVASLWETNGAVHFKNRARLRLNQALDTVDIQGRFRITGDSRGLFAILMRTAGGTNASGGVSDGVTVVFLPVENPGSTNQIQIYAPGGVWPGNEAQHPIYMNTNYDFRIRDDGDNISVYVTDLVTPVITAPFTSDDGDVTIFCNRERLSADCNSELDYIRIAAIIAPPTNICASDGEFAGKVTVSWALSSGATGYQIFRCASNNSASAEQIGTATSTTYDDISTAAGTFYYYWIRATNSTETSVFSTNDIGYAKDIHSINDYDGDGISDLAVYGNGYWNIYSLTNSSILLNGKWGGPGWTTVPGDYDGDGKFDLAVYDNGYWYICSLANGNILLNGKWGGPGWTPVPGDYDGDGKSDLAVYGGGLWYIYSLANGSILLNGKWGGPGWTPVQ